MWWQRATWREVRDQVLPLIAQACANLPRVPPAGAGGGLAEDSEWDTRLAGVTCTHPDCTNQEGAEEAALPLRACTACSTSRYCSR